MRGRMLKRGASPPSDTPVKAGIGGEAPKKDDYRPGGWEIRVY